MRRESSACPSLRSMSSYGLQRRRRASSVSVASAAPRQRSIARRCLREQQLEALLSSLDLVTNRDVSPLVIERQGQRPSVRAFELEVDAVAALHGWSALELLGRSKHSARAQNRLYVFGFQLPRAAVRREQRHGHDRTFRTRVRSPTRRHEVWSGRRAQGGPGFDPRGCPIHQHFHTQVFFAKRTECAFLFRSNWTPSASEKLCLRKR